MSELQIQFKAQVIANRRITIPYEEALAGDIEKGDFVQVTVEKISVKERERN